MSTLGKLRLKLLHKDKIGLDSYFNNFSEID